MFNYFDYFNRGYIFGVKTDKYYPYINYSWSQTLTVGGNQQIKDSGTAGLNLQQFFGQGCWFNGIDMQITVPVNATIQTEIKRVNGVTEINTNTQNLTNYNVYSGSGAKVYKDLYMFNRALTQAEIEKYNNQPNQFFMDSLEDSSCVLAMPMCEKNNLVRNYKNNTDYPITNYLITCRTNAQRLPYGLQTSGFKRDSNGLILSKSNFLEADGVGYANTGWISPLATEAETIEIIFTEPLVVQDNYNKIFSQTGTALASAVEIDKGTKNRLTIRYRGIAKTSQLMSGTAMLTLVASSYTSYIYLNGSLSSMGTKVDYTTVQSLLLGAFSLGLLGAQNVKGTSIRLFKVHNKALTQEEVTKNFNKYQAQGLLNE